MILGALLPDLDHIWTYIKRNFRGADSRTWFHELPVAGMLAVGAVFVWPDFGLGLIAHIFLDFVTGETRPFAPFSKLKVDFNWSVRVKMVIGGILWAIGARLMLV